MSRKIILTLAAAATLATATFAPYSADARDFGRGMGGGGSFSGRFASFSGHGGRLVPILTPGRPDHPTLPPPVIGFHDHDHDHHHHWIFRDGRWIIIDEVVGEGSAVVTAPGPCTCLTKTYTPSGLVVFADICTKESASASVDGTADATQVPTTPVAATAVPMSAVPTTPNYAGRTYEDYLAANPQAASPQAANPPAAQKN